MIAATATIEWPLVCFFALTLGVSIGRVWAWLDAAAIEAHGRGDPLRRAWRDAAAGQNGESGRND